MRDFWISSGHHLLDRGPGGGLVPTAAFLRAYLARPEVVPPAEACAAERSLHGRLLADPYGPVTGDDLGAILDEDARDNWAVLAAFRDHLLRHPTLEAAYLSLARDGPGGTPPLFIDQLVHLVLRNALDGCTDPLMLRAAELFFRAQRVSFHEGAVLLADREIIDRHAREHRPSPLLAMFGQAPFAQLDVLGPSNAELYWSRSDAFDTVLDLGPGRGALARVLERWLAHLLGINGRVEALARIEDEAWAWFVALDAAGTAIGNALWRGLELDETTLAHVLALFRLDLAPDVPVLDPIRGRPIYLILGMTAQQDVILKPQNLIAGLPLRRSHG